jgi:sulfate adenylyltransferase subunit 2
MTVTAPTETRRVDELRLLEAEAVHIIREVVAELQRPVLLFSAGKDSIVLLRLAEKAFRPLPLPFPVMHVDTGHNFGEVIEFRDRRVTGHGHKLIVASVQESIDSGRVPDPDPGASRNREQTRTLLDALEAGGFDAAFGGARRDEERARAKERILSFRERVRPVGSPCAASGAVVALQRPDQKGRTGAGLPTEQLDRARRVALHPAGRP